MSLIVAARFQTFDEATLAARRLFAEGYTEEDVHTFYVSIAGEHGRYPLGGDRLADPDAKGGHFGAVAGASLLGLVFALLAGLIAARLAASIFITIAAAGVGAYIGALMGAMWVVGRKKRVRTAPGAPAASHPPVRQAGVMLALHVDLGREAQARQILRAAGGTDIERANGRWQDGKWQDFDPLDPPRPFEAPTTAQ